MIQPIVIQDHPIDGRNTAEARRLVYFNVIKYAIQIDPAQQNQSVAGEKSSQSYSLANNVEEWRPLNHHVLPSGN